MDNILVVSRDNFPSWNKTCRTKVKYFCEKCGKEVIKSYAAVYDSKCFLCKSHRLEEIIAERYEGNRDLYNKAKFEKSKETMIKKYGSVENARKSMIKKVEQTNLKKYGFKSSASAESTKEKAKKNNLEKFGVEFTFQRDDFKKKRKEKCLEKYGAEFTLQSPDLIKKVRSSCKKKYGSEFLSSVQEIKEKVKSTNIEKYGVPYTFQSSLFKEESEKTCMEKYGTKTFFHNKVLYEYDGKLFNSSYELCYWIYCKDNGYDIVREPCRFEFIRNDGKIHFYYPDFSVNGKIIEIKGDQFLDEKGELLDKEKLQCMKEHNVQMLRKIDLKECFDYIEKKYGKKYLESFKKEKKLNE